MRKNSSLPLGVEIAKTLREIKPPPRLNLVEWAERFRYVAQKTSASAGKWKTNRQPIAYGPMMAVSEPDTFKISVMAATQILKTELLINVVLYYMHQDPLPILFIQPTQDLAEAFAKERLDPAIAASPALRALIKTPKAGSNGNTLTHKEAPGAHLNLVGGHSPGDLASRPCGVVASDEINKFPASAGAEGDPLKLGEERASTYLNVGRGKLVRTCSPTVKGECRIGKEYEASDQRRCFLACPHCGAEQVLGWRHVKWEKVLTDGTVTLDIEEGQVVREHRPETACLSCESCGTLWSEEERKAVIRRLEHEPDHGWRQTKRFTCCEVEQVPSEWNAAGRSLCTTCGEPSRYNGHAGFHASKLYSIRHNLPALVSEFLDAKGSPEELKKFVNSGLAEHWEPVGSTIDPTGFRDRAEVYGPDDLPEAVLAVTGFCDVQGDRLEVQLVGWGADEEAWPFTYEVIREDPAQPMAWNELDALLAREFTTRDGRTLRIGAFGIDTGGNHTAQVFSYCRRRKGRRVFACKGMSGNKPLWPTNAIRAKSNDHLYMLGVDSGKESLYGRLKIKDPGPGFIHFPALDEFGDHYFSMLTAERREVRKRAGTAYTVWVPIRERNEALDTFVGALAVRRSLPHRIQRGVEFAAARPAPDAEPRADVPVRVPQPQEMGIGAFSAPRLAQPAPQSNQSGQQGPRVYHPDQPGGQAPRRSWVSKLAR